MRLLLQEYVGMMTEEVELESVVSALVMSMGLDILSLPQKGVRQDGVDIHAVGIDPSDNQRKNYLITIKKGNITRTAWDGSNQAVRTSLNQIIDVYAQNKIPIDHKSNPTKIILCCGGELKQEIQADWAGYQASNAPKGFQFEIWNGSTLSSLIEKHLLNENVFFEEVRKKMRRTLVVLSDYGYDLSHYKEMLNAFLFNDDWKTLSGSALEKKAIKTLATIPVCLGMIHEYSKESDNSKHPLIAAEFTLLRVWDFIRTHKLENNEKVFAYYHQLFEMYSKLGAEFFQKTSPHAFVPDGITIHCRNSITASEVVFEQIGILASLGLSQIFWGLATKEQENLENAKVISETLMAVISNNGISGSPCFDEMTIDVSLAVFFLYICGERQFINDWFFKLVQRFSFSYVVLGKGFPVGYDSIETLVEFEKEQGHTKEEMSGTSTLLALIGYWCVLLDNIDLYPQLVDFIETKLPHCTVQMWFPRKGIKDHLFKGYAAHEFGIAEAPIHFPKSLEELKARLVGFIEFAKSSDAFETDWGDSPPAIELIASRHFRTPVVPFFWLNHLAEGKPESSKP